MRELLGLADVMPSLADLAAAIVTGFTGGWIARGLVDHSGRREG